MEVIKPIWSYGVELRGCASKSNTVIMQRSQSKILRATTNAPRHVTNHTLHTDLNIPYVSDVIHERINKHHNKLEAHPNPLLQPLLQPINTYLLTPFCRVLLEKLTGLQLVKKFPAFHGTRRFITALTSVRHLSLSWANRIQSIYPHPTSWRSILILSTHLRLGLPIGLFPSGFPTKTPYTPSPINTRRLKSFCSLDLQGIWGDIVRWIPYHVIAIHGIVTYLYNHHISLEIVFSMSANKRNCVEILWIFLIFTCSQSIIVFLSLLMMWPGRHLWMI